VVKLEPLPNETHPVDAAYQSIVVPAGLVAEIVTVPLPQVEPPVAPVAAAGIAFTVATTSVLVADTHPVVVFLAWA
jgi:hypothetical protein